MQFFSFGLNHHNAPVEIRDRYTLDVAAIRRLYEELELSDQAEYIIISTCNRLECLLYGLEYDRSLIKQWFAEEAGHSWPESIAFTLKDEKAVMHALEVTVGLDSMVIGDAQILGQVKSAYRLAVEAHVVDSVLHRLMHTAFGAAKRILNETQLVTGRASVAGTAAALASRHLSKDTCNAPTGQVLVLGAGEMGRLVVDALSRESGVQLFLTNRSQSRIRKIEEVYDDVSIVEWQNRYTAVTAVDVVIVTTSAPGYVLDADVLVRHVSSEHTGNKKTLIIDIAMPRNVDPAIGEWEEILLLNLDALQAEIEQVMYLRTADVPPARKICEDMLSDFVAWFFHHQAMQPAIRAIQHTFESIRRQEIDRHQHRFSDTDAGELDRLTKSIMQKVLSVPVVRLKKGGLDKIDYVHGIKVLSTLFAHAPEEDFSSLDFTVSRHAIETLAQSGNANLAELASCPFHERAVSERTTKQFSPGIMTGGKSITLGTRASALAMWQATHIKKIMESIGFEVHLKQITTKGDQVLDKPFAAIQGKSLFTKELDIALLSGEIDLAVHSLKDLPAELPAGLTIAAIPPREQPFDVFIGHKSYEGSYENLPHGAILGTSSLRRTSQLRAWRPDIHVVPVRGNVDTRIKKLDASDWHGIVLAAAGIHRLGLVHRITATLPATHFLPAPGQGALAVVCAEANTALGDYVRTHMHHEEDAIAVRSERALLHALDGGCQVPVGALATRETEGLVLSGFVGSVDGTKTIQARAFVDPGDPETAGVVLAREMRRQGASVILEKEKSVTNSG